MKKRILAIVFALALFICAAAFSAQAGQMPDPAGVYDAAVSMTKENVLSGGTVSANCPACGTEVSWEPLPAITGTTVPQVKTQKHYYLSEDLHNKTYYSFESKVCLHLNGHSLESSARAIYVETGASLSIMGDGTVSGVGLSHSTCDRGGALDIAGTVNLYGGTYKHTGNYPVITSRGSKGGINMYSGTHITGTSGYNGSNIRVYVSYLNMYGGTIENGIGTQGGNIYGGKNAKVTIAGGTITGGTVYMAEDSASLTLTGSPKVDVINHFDGPAADISGLTQGADIQIVGQGVITKAHENMGTLFQYLRSPNELVKLSVKDGAVFAAVDTTGDSDAPLSDGKTLKILCLTSSFGLNTTELLYDIAVAEGFEDVIVARLYASGCTLKKHVDAFNSDTGIYWYTKFTADGKAELDDAKLLDGLLDEDWDIIYIQQGAEQTPQLQTYLDYLDQLMVIVNAHKTNANAKFIWNQTWAFQWDNPRKIFTDTFQGNQLLMHEAIIDAMQEKILTRSDFCALIPTGAAVQNARTSYFGDRLTKDTLHLNNLGRVIGGYTVLATLLDKDITEVNVGSVKTYDLTTSIRISETDRQVIIESVNNARKDPFQVFQSKYTPEYLNGIGAKAKAMSFTGSSEVTAPCPYCEKDVVWYPLTNSSANKLATTNGNWGHYYLAEDLTYSSKYLYAPEASSHDGYCLHLNGHDLTSSGKRALWVGVGSTMNIMGSGTVCGIGEGAKEADWRATAVDVTGHVNLFGGIYTNADARPVVMARSGTSRVNLFDGATIRGNKDYSVSAILLRNASAEFNMWGGMVEGGKAANGGSIRISAKATFNMFGGTMQGGQSTSIGGNVYASNGTVNMYGGSIYGGSAENSSSSYGRGGNVALNGSSSGGKPEFYMYGGTIGSKTVTGEEAGYATSGGANLYVAYGTAEILGKDALISGGHAESYGGNVMVSTSGTVTLTDGTIAAGKSERGGNIYLAGTSSALNVNGGTVQGGIASSTGSNVYANNGIVAINGGTFIHSATTGSTTSLHLKVGNASASNMVTVDYDSTLSKTAPLVEGGAILMEYNVTLGKFTLSDRATPAVNIASNAKLTILPSFTQEITATVDAKLLGTPVYGSTVANAVTQGSFPGKIYLAGYQDAPYLHGKEGDTALYVTGTALVSKSGNKTWFESNADAVAAYHSDTAWLQAAPGELALTQGAYTVDLAGHAVNMTGAGSVTCFDSANDTYNTCGTATIQGVTLANEFMTHVAGKDYCILEENGTYTFHRLGVEIVTVSLRPSIGGIYYTGKWSCDAALAEKIDSFGVVVSTNDMPDSGFAGDPVPDSHWSVFLKDQFENGVEKTGVMISNILKGPANGASADRVALNPLYGKLPIYAAAYIVIDGNTCISEGVSHSLYDVIRAIDEQIADMPQHAQAMKDFLSYWQENGLTGEEWNFDFEPTN